jgi:glutamyl-Q tRNA(Asp) synthetase
VYAGRCRACQQKPAVPYAVRLQIETGTIEFDDLVQGPVAQDLAREVGDFVLVRKEALPAYQLAVVVDDAAQGITRIVRGSDLLDSTPRQIFLQRHLELPTPAYAHIPIIANADGQKLSKQTFAPALDNGAALQNLQAALDFLGQPPPDARHRRSIDALLAWAIAHWRLEAVPRVLKMLPEDLPPSCRCFSR